MIKWFLQKQEQKPLGAVTIPKYSQNFYFLLLVALKPWDFQISF